MTVVFRDLVDSTALATQLDPEEVREVVRAYQHTCAKVIDGFDGHIAQYLGDGLLVYFGYPQAHEDDPQRAARTGLGIVKAQAGLNARLHQDHGIQLTVRVGIHPGLVVVGEMGGGGRQEQLALGDTPNVSARLQGIAAPDTVVISAATHQLLQGYFECLAPGPHTLKGVSTPVPIYQVVEESGAQGRLEVAGRTGLTPLVGRAEEMELLLRRWEQVKAGEGQVVMLGGEAGIGKSRLVQALKARVVREGDTRIEFRCSPYHQNSALYPVIEHLQRLLQFSREDCPAARVDKLERVLTACRLPVQEVVPL
jgi:class 3 adenylate cyclase